MPTTERAEKRRRVHALLDREGLDTLVLRSPANLAWWSCGGRTNVLLDQPVGVAAVVITRGSETVVTDEIEAGRLAEEELAALVGDGARFDVLPWADAAADPVAALPKGAGVGDDVPRSGVRDVSGLMEAARRSLTPAEVDRYRALGNDAATAFTDASAQLDPSTSEYAAAGLLAECLLERALDPTVQLIAGESRVGRWRHPLPTSAPVGRLVMLVACARRAGLYANVTRFVAFGGLAHELADPHRHLLAVEAAFLDALSPGVLVRDVLAAGSTAYATHGFAADEWRRHHQGGPTGYYSRDHLATSACDERVEEAQAFAWNPSVPSLKVEDTVLATSNGVEVLTVDPRWPVVEVSGRARPVALER